MTKLPYIHYSDPRINYGEKEVVVYGYESKNLKWAYSDRLFEYTRKIPKESGQSDIEYWKRVLKIVQDKEVSIECVLIGANSATMFHYYVFGYKEIKNND